MFTNTEPRSAAAPGSRTFYPGSRLAEISPNLSLIFNVICTNKLICTKSILILDI